MAPAEAWAPPPCLRPPREIGSPSSCAPLGQVKTTGVVIHPRDGGACDRNRVEQTITERGQFAVRERFEAYRGPPGTGNLTAI